MYCLIYNNLTNSTEELFSWVTVCIEEWPLAKQAQVHVSAAARQDD